MINTDKDDEINFYIKQFLLNFEKENNINLFFVCETNSRPQGVEVEDSDFDLKGFYLPHPDDSLKIIPKTNSCYKIDHLKILVKNKEFDVDVEFLDLRQFAVEKVRDNIIYFDYSLFSPTIYINKYPHIIQNIKSKLIPSPDEFLFKFKNLHEACEKSIIKSNECKIKKLLSALINGIQYFHVNVFKNFPTYNIWEEIQFIKNNFEILLKDNIIVEQEKILLQMIFTMIDYYYQEKKKRGRKSNSNNISEYQTKFLNWLNDKYKKKERKKIKKESENNFDLEFFEDSMQEILSDWLNIKLK